MKKDPVHLNKLKYKLKLDKLKRSSDDGPNGATERFIERYKLKSVNKIRGGH